jgi:hypothetical protein
MSTPAHDEQRDERLQELLQGARSLHRPHGRLNDRWLLVAGSIGVAAGFVAILLGWYGVSQTPLEFEQTPYLVSGGILGLALVIIGGLLYFSFWLTTLVREGRVQARRTAAHQDRMEVLLAELVRAQDKPGRKRSTSLVVTPNGTVLHRPDCPSTRGQAITAAGPGLALPPCQLCRPEIEGAAS